MRADVNVQVGNRLEVGRGRFAERHHLDADAAAREHWNGFSPSSRKAILWWVASAKRPETRARRIEQTARMAARGLRAQFDRE